MKYEVGHDWPVPEGYTVHREMGGYKIVSDENGFYLLGDSLYNLTESPIFVANIVPMMKKKVDEMDVISKEQTGSGNATIAIFNFDPTVIYYFVKYGGLEEGSGVFIFTDLDSALDMVGFMTYYKGYGLEESLGGNDK